MYLAIFIVPFRYLTKVVFAVLTDVRVLKDKVICIWMMFMWLKKVSSGSFTQTCRAWPTNSHWQVTVVAYSDTLVQIAPRLKNDARLKVLFSVHKVSDYSKVVILNFSRTESNGKWFQFQHHPSQFGCGWHNYVESLGVYVFN